MRLSILLAGILFCFSCHMRHHEIDKVTESIEKVRKEHVPDKRTALFDVTSKESSGNLVIFGETTIPEAKKQLLDMLDQQEVAYVDSIVVLPSDDLKGKYFGLVNVSVCNIRSEPRHSAELGTQALMGTPLRVWKKDGAFYMVQTPDNYFGWVDDGGLALKDKPAYDAWMHSDRVVCIEDFVFAYEQASEDSTKVTDLLAGNILQFVEKGRSFTEIRLPDGRAGFVKNEYLVPYPEWLDSRDPTPENILASAYEMMGRPYLWGGTSGKGVDCSGFTKMVYFLNGIQLERDASLQVRTGEEVETDTTLKNLLPGDLLFFGSPATKDKKERVTHVAIYVGDGKIIHSSDRVKVESMRRGDPTFSEGRLKSFLYARRILGSEGKNGIIALDQSPYYKLEPSQ